MKINISKSNKKFTFEKLLYPSDPNSIVKRYLAKYAYV